jgi:hypothetical protein
MERITGCKTEPSSYFCKLGIGGYECDKDCENKQGYFLHDIRFRLVVSLLEIKINIPILIH